MLPTLALPAALAAGAAFGLILGLLVWRSCRRSCRRSSIRWSGLIVDDVTGAVSGTKVCALVGFAAVTAIFLRVGWNAAPGDGLAMLLLIYYGLATGSQFASKLVGARFGASAATPGTTTTETKLEEKKTTVAAAPVPVANPELAVNPTGRSTS